MCTHDVTSLAAASRDTKVPASTALRLLRTMEREHFVVRDDEAGWRAGPRLLQLAVRSLAREPLARLARPALARLTAITGESAYLSVRGADGLAVHVAAGEGTYRCGTPRGSGTPSRWTARRSARPSTVP